MSDLPTNRQSGLVLGCPLSPASNLMRLKKFGPGLTAVRLHTDLPVQDRYGVIRPAERTHHHEQKRMTLPLEEFLRRFPIASAPKASFVFATSVSSPTRNALLSWLRSARGPDCAQQ